MKVSFNPLLDQENLSEFIEGLRQSRVVHGEVGVYIEPNPSKNHLPYVFKAGTSILRSYLTDERTVEGLLLTLTTLSRDEIASVLDQAKRGRVKLNCS